MKTKSILSLRTLALAGAALLLLAAAPGRAHARFVLTLTQTAGNVVVNGSGTINITGLTASSDSGTGAAIAPAGAELFAGPTSSQTFSTYIMQYANGATGVSSFGTGGYHTADAGTGAFAGVQNEGQSAFGISVPQGYTSGTLLTDSATFTGTTFASLGFTPGTYTYTWGTGANADSLTVTSVVPEPSTWALFIVGSVSLLGVMSRRRSA